MSRKIGESFDVKIPKVLADKTEDSLFTFFSVAKIKYGMFCKRDEMRMSPGFEWPLTKVEDPEDEESCRRLSWPAKRSVPSFSMAVFPGSGSKWVNMMAEYATGIETEISRY